MRFNPPPNWPPPPPGFAPDGNWAPDPSWPPPPPGWQLWVDDSGAQPPPGHPVPSQWPQQPPRSRKVLWVALATAAVVAVAVAAFFVIVDRSEKGSRKPDITALTPDLLVDRSVFPEITGGKWRSGVDKGTGGEPSMSNLTIEPPECGDFFGDSARAEQTAVATLSELRAGRLRSIGVHLFITRERLSVQDYLKNCRSFTQSFRIPGRAVTTDVQLEPFHAEGVPPWAAAATMTSSSSATLRVPVGVTATMIFGYRRGVLVIASNNEVNLRPKDNTTADTGVTGDLVKLFNAQVEKLEAVP